MTLAAAKNSFWVLTRACGVSRNRIKNYSAVKNGIAVPCNVLLVHNPERAQDSQSNRALNFKSSRNALNESTVKPLYTGHKIHSKI